MDGCMVARVSVYQTKHILTELSNFFVTLAIYPVFVHYNGGLSSIFLIQVEILKL